MPLLHPSNLATRSRSRARIEAGDISGAMLGHPRLERTGRTGNRCTHDNQQLSPLPRGRDPTIRCGSRDVPLDQIFGPDRGIIGAPASWTARGLPPLFFAPRASPAVGCSHVSGLRRKRSSAAAPRPRGERTVHGQGRGEGDGPSSWRRQGLAHPFSPRLCPPVGRTSISRQGSRIVPPDRMRRREESLISRPKRRETRLLRRLLRGS